MIYRAKKTKGTFTIIHKDLINDSTITPQAKGVMIYLLSQNDDWQFYETEINSHFKCNIKTMHKIMLELIKAGYIQRQQSRDKDGKFLYNYNIYETKQTKIDYGKPPST